MKSTGQAGRFRDRLPAEGRRTLLRPVDGTATDPHGPDTHLACTNDDVTRSARAGGVMVHHAVTSFYVVIVEADVHDARRGFNEV